jgi:glycosyltransferase involved in cell wall biosynthesis
MHILMLIQSSVIEGALPKHTPLLIESLEEYGHDISTSVWGRHTERETFPEKIIGRVKDLHRAKRKLLEQHFDIMVVKTSHDWLTLSRDILLLLATRHLCPCIILQMHGSQSNRLVTKRDYLFKIATKWLLRHCDGVLILSSEEQRQWQHFYPQGRFYVVDNPYLPPSNEYSSADQETKLETPAGYPVLLFVGRLIVEKGIYELLESLPIILRQTKCHLVMTGVGPEKARLQKRIQELGLQQTITLTGYLEGSSLSYVYQRADIFVLPSYSEGFPTAIAEAMFAGLPIVTTQIRGMADHLQAGINALFIPPKDSRALANAILRLLVDTDLRAHMRNANREKIKQFEPYAISANYHNIFKEIFNAKETYLAI